MDFELPFLARMRASQTPELTASEALQHMARASHRGRWPRKVKVTGRIKGPLRSETPDEATFILEDGGTPLTVKLPRMEADGLAPGQRVVLEGRLFLTARASSLEAVLKGHLVSGEQLRRDTAHLRQLPRLPLTEFFQRPESCLVILGSERALRDVDDEMTQEGCYPGPVRREIVRMTERAEVLAAAYRYRGVAQAVLFVRRGGEGHEFKFWSDPVFIQDLLEAGLHVYLGLGHAEDRTALDALADETFPTASAAGMALARALRAPRKTPGHDELLAVTPTVKNSAPLVKDAGLAEKYTVPAMKDVKPAVNDNAILLNDTAPAGNNLAFEVKEPVFASQDIAPAFNEATLSKPATNGAARQAAPESQAKEELYLSNTMIWIIALILGAIVLILGLR
jgi:hypothetical protein